MSLDASPRSVREVFLAALEFENDSERQGFLDATCGVGTDRRREIEQLLAAHRAGLSSPLDDAVARFVPTEILPPPGLDVSTHPAIGPYKIREQIGEGGFGVVYVAEQAAPVRRKVALKIIKPGMDTQEVVARFEAEKQALAMMDHPHIAKVFDAGTTDTGRPYFAMELIRGMPITQYCREKKLDLRDELKLFMDVCRAVQHAHQKGIIHRDLKPSNILITLHDGEPVVKIIDFGIAKALHQKLSEHTIYTRHAQLIGTPVYMSPEQAELSGLDIDTRSDVYSLGVLLYELLTGTPPFDQKILMSQGFDEMRRVIREDDPPRPSHRISTLDFEMQSTLEKARGLDPRQWSLTLKRELDWIVMKALEKNRERRYESASDLAADVERYLNDEPVEACPPSLGYRLKKAAKRNKGLLTTMILVVLALVMGLGVAAWQAIEASAARDEAIQQRDIAKDSEKKALANEKKAVANFNRAMNSIDGMLRLIQEDKIAGNSALGPLTSRLLGDAKNLCDELIDEGQLMDGQRQRVFKRRALIQFLQGEYEDALSDISRAVELNPRDESNINWIPHHLLVGCPDPEFGEGMLRLADKAVQEADNAGLRIVRAGLLGALGHRRRSLVDYDKAIELEPEQAHFYMLRSELLKQLEQHHRVIADYNKILELKPRDDFWYGQRAMAYFNVGQYDKALADLTKARELNPSGGLVFNYHRTFANCPDEAFREGILKLADEHLKTAKGALTWIGHARLMNALGKTGRALADYDEAIEIEPERALWRDFRANFFAERGRWPEAADDYGKAVELSPHIYTFHYRHALTLLAAGDQRGYQAGCRQMLHQFRKSEAKEKLHFASWTCALGPKALADYAPAIALAQDALDQEPENQQFLLDLAGVQMRAGKFDDALGNLQKAAQRSSTEMTSNAYIAYFQAMNELHLNRPDAARKSLATANELAEKELSDELNPPAWNRKLTLELLRKEAEALIGKSLSGEERTDRQSAPAVAEKTSDD